MTRIFLVLGLAVVFAGCDKLGGDVNLDSEDSQVIYSIGHDMGTKLQTLQLSDSEMKYLHAGLKDGLESKKAKIAMRDIFPKVTAFIRKRSDQVREKEMQEANAFLAAKEKEEGVEKTGTGLLYKEMTKGEGKTPKETDRVKVHYHGTLRDGTVFDSSKERGEPTSFWLNRVIKCWTEGLQKMQEGGKAMLYCPPDIAYGDKGAPPKIKPGAALAFEVELLEVLEDVPPPQAPGGLGNKLKEIREKMKNQKSEKKNK